MWIAIAAVLAIAAAATTWAVAGRDDPPAGSSAATPTSTVSEPPVEERMLAGAGAILKTRAAAVLTGRLSQYLQYVDPANKKLRERDQQVFANLRKLGLSRLSYQVDANWAPEVQAQHGPSARAVRVLMLIQIAGIDAAPRATGLGYTFAERDGRWLLVDDDDLAAEADLKAYREPWDLGAIEVARRPGVLVVVPAGERGNAERLARESQAAIPIVRSTTRRVPAGILVIAMADNRSMDPEWRTGGHPAAAVAAHNFAPANPEASEFKVVGSRVVINPGQRTRSGRLLLAHEFTHAAMGQLGNSAPTWLVEGFAMYVENRLAAQNGYEQELAAERRTLLREKISALVVLPIDGVFHGDYDEDSYGVSWIIVEYLVTKYGQAAVNSLYADLARGPDAPAVREQVLRKHLKSSETALVAALKKYDGPN
ncbi:hypothetical protein E0H50_06840 [Kribbella sindirgiensis]|uniref:Peptidase MA-like domain-containing protein n=1 Tax=Kribbella sindirgiensis TaxID=1124744 RepID=A0A4R0J0L7_9ACTN|nr:hypothetical protein E0H50_06840 [Kribbella sindirgiensis]